MLCVGIERSYGWTGGMMNTRLVRSGLWAACGLVFMGQVAVAQPQTEAADEVRFGMNESRAKAAGTIRLATYNIENLFDDKDDPALTGRNDDDGMVKSYKHRKAAAKAIHELDADILALEEIESEEALLWFRDEFLSDMGYEFVASIDAGDSRGIECSVLSRYPITDIRNWPGEKLGGVHPEKYGDKRNYFAGEPITFHRSPLRVDIQVGGGGAEMYDLTLFVVHQKSSRYSGYWREAEAKGLAGKIAEAMAEDAGRNIAVLGDFNCKASQEPILILKRAGLTVLREKAALAGKPEAMSHESGRSIDFILVNDNLMGEVVPGSSFVLGTPARPKGANWRTTKPPGGYASDHYPVVVDITPRESGNEGVGGGGGSGGGGEDSGSSVR